MNDTATGTSRWSLVGTTALVTGGTKGIGFAIVEELARLDLEQEYTLVPGPKLSLISAYSSGRSRSSRSQDLCVTYHLRPKGRSLWNPSSPYSTQSLIFWRSQTNYQSNASRLQVHDEHKLGIGLPPEPARFHILHHCISCHKQWECVFSNQRHLCNLADTMAFYHSSSTNNDRVGVLEICLRDILVEIKPVESDRVQRLHAIRQLEQCLRGLLVFRGVAVSLRPFGSFVSDLYTKWGDLDVSVQIDNTPPIGTTTTTNTPPNGISRNMKKYYLRQIMRALRRTGFAQITQYIPNARVPLLKYISRHHNISFDVSVDNHLGVMKSSILKWLSEIDDRFRDMVLVTKEWAKVQNINDPKSGTLNSYSLCLLVIFHFQTCEPPILPPLQVICEGNIANEGWTSFSERHVEDVCSANIQRFRSRRRINKSSLSQLLVSFFNKLSGIGSLASEYSVSTFEGRLKRITSDLRSPLFIEDPFERPENAARTVRAQELHKISNAFRDAHDKLSSSLVLSDRDSLLFLLTRPILASKLRDQQPVTNYNTRSQHSNVATIDVLERQFENTLRLDRIPSPASTSMASIRPTYRNF